MGVHYKLMVMEMEIISSEILIWSALIGNYKQFVRTVIRVASYNEHKGTYNNFQVEVCMEN